MAPDQFAALERALDDARHCGSLYRKRIQRDDGMWWYALFVNQPKTAALQHLASLEPKCWITEVHLALDLLTETEAQAELLQTYIENRLVKSKRRVQATTEVAETTYIDRNLRRGVEVALYSDRPCKYANGHPCMHIDWRVRGAHALRTANLHTPDALLALNYLTFWEQRLRLDQAPSREELHSIRLKEIAARGYPVRLNEQVDLLLNRMSRLTSGRDGNYRTNDLLRFLSEHPNVFGRRARRLFVRQSISWMLPSNVGALW